MRTKDEIINVYKDESLTRSKTQDILGLTEALKLEVLIDIRDILQYHLLRIGDLYSSFKERD
jgi:hypothetical protein